MTFAAERDMGNDAELPNGDPQSLYFPEGHEKVGWFKGMAQLLVERGYVNAPNLKAECKDFKCPGGTTECCCRRLMFMQSDFASVSSVLESTCQARGCWGYAKRLYRMMGMSSSDAVLERNIVNALDAVPLSSMRRFAIRSARFIDAYQKGLNGVQSAWAIKKYRGHRVLPSNIMQEFDEAHSNFTSSII